MAKKNVVWGNIDLKVEDWADYFEEYEQENDVVLDEDEKYELMVDMNSEYLDDERINLNIDLPNKILVIADLGLWNGRKCGYKIIDNNVKNCLYSNADYVEWYCDRYNLKSTEVHHDGTNYCTYRMIKDGVNIDNLLDKILEGTVTSKDISRYTTSIRKYISDVYGF